MRRRFRPFFPLSGEAEVFGGELSVPLTSGGALPVLKHRDYKKLASVCPERWYGTVRTASRGPDRLHFFHEESGELSGFLWSGAGEGIQSKDRFREGFPTPPSAVYKEHGQDLYAIGLSWTGSPSNRFSMHMKS